MKSKLKQAFTSNIRKWLTVIILSCFLSANSALYAQNSSDSDDKSSNGEDYHEVNDKIKDMIEELQKLQKKLSDIKTYQKKQIKKLSNRIDKTELHAATDKISFGIEFDTNVESLHYRDIYTVPDAAYGALIAGSPLDASALAKLLKGMPFNKIKSADNNMIFTEKIRITMKSKFNAKLDFTGRLAAYKVWGDSSGVKFNNGSLGDVYMDGTTGSMPSGDNIHLERAYFNYKFNVTDNIPASISVGRRPSTGGSPLEFREYGLEGGSPIATAINWQFDGISLNFDLENFFNIPGHVFKLCYGIAFESGWGNSYSLTNSPDIEDVNVFGFIDTIYNDSVTNLTALYAHGADLTDGFTGLTLMPMNVNKNPMTQEYDFSQNEGGWISRVEPQTNIGDYDILSLLLKTNLKSYFETKGDIDFFSGISFSRTSPSNVSKISLYEPFGMGLLSSNGELKSRNGYSFYLGTRLSMPNDGKLGFEYNWGSKYWLSMTAAEDSLIGSKIATRGHAYEVYYIQPIFNQNFFAKMGLIYYDYIYSGSGNPLGAPVRIEGITTLDEMIYSTALSPIIDNAFNLYFSVTFRF